MEFNRSETLTLTSVNRSSSVLPVRTGVMCNYSSTSEPEELESEPWTPWSTMSAVLTTVPMCLLIAEIILGNLLVTVAVLTKRQLRTPSNMIILSLAIADLAVGVFILPLNIADMLYKWRYGVILCRIWLTADVTLCSTSILHISAIAVDRFRSINEGVSYAQGRTIRMSLIVCGALWLIALWIASSPVLGWNDWKSMDSDKDKEMMDCHLTRELGYIIHSASGAFFIPAVIMVGLYFRIFLLIRHKLRERAKIACVTRNSRHKIQEEEPQTDEHSSGDIVEDASSTDATLGDCALQKPKKSFDSVGSTSGFLSAEEDSQTSKTRKKHSEQIETILRNKLRFSLTKERKAAQTLGIIIGAFIICWTPFTLIYLSSGILMELYQRPVIPWALFQAVTWLGYVNSGINPIIYTIYNPDFRRAFTEILKQFKF